MNEAAKMPRAYHINCHLYLSTVLREIDRNKIFNENNQINSNFLIEVAFLCNVLLIY